MPFKKKTEKFPDGKTSADSTCDFHMSRTAGVLLEAQFAEWLKSGIAHGRWPAGTPLPGIVELSRRCRVSTTTVRAALGRLAKGGWIRPVRHVGSVVLERGIRRKRVLLWEAGTFFCYYSSQFLSVLRSELMRGKNGVTVVGANSLNPRHQLDEIREYLKEPWDAVVSHGCGMSVLRTVAESGCPFFAVGNGGSIRSIPPELNCAGRVEVLNGLAVPDFARKCAERNVRSVAQVLCHVGAYDVSAILRISGIPVRTFRTPLLNTPESVAMAGYDLVESWFERGKVSLPDVILFADDYVAQGGLIALKKHGVSIPEDVAVVTHANKGSGPIWEKPLTRMEMDPVAHAVVVAKALRGYLRGKPFPKGIKLGSVWRDGETF